MYIDLAKYLLHYFRKRFFKGDYFYVADLLQEVHSIQQEEKNITQFFIV